MPVDRYCYVMASTNYLADILVLLAAAVVAVPMFKRLGLGAVLGYLAAGVLVGPWGFGFIGEVAEIRHIAEFGVIFLLFLIGIELKPARLWAMRRMVFGFGTAQVLVTGLAIAAVALAFGQSFSIAVIVGFSLALSSTAFGLQLLNERAELNTVHGQAAFSVLLLQDLAVVPLLTLVSLLAADSSLIQGIEFAILEALLAIAVAILAGRFLLSPLLWLVAKSRTAELFTAAAVFAVLATAWLMQQAGLSLALGAFLAGLMLADSHYRHQLIADIEPFRGILLGLFFMGVGMSIDFGVLAGRPSLVIGLVAGLLLLKASILWVLSRLMGLAAADAGRVALLLSQSGEFGFVIFGVAAVSGILPPELFQLLMLLVALSMATTPLMANLCGFLGRCSGATAVPHRVSTDHVDADAQHVIIAGFGRVGRRIASILRARGVPYLAIDNNADLVLEGRGDGFAVFYGDASDVEVLKAAGAGRAGVMVCTLDEVVAATRLVEILRQHFADIPVFARGRDRRHCRQLLRAGATLAISETLEASVQIGAETLRSMGVEEADAHALIETFRKDYYG
jgi:monovalent cation:proton antiporter-2 (CPA2) family protein